jgi:hypothetical protein
MGGGRDTALALIAASEVPKLRTAAITNHVPTPPAAKASDAMMRPVMCNSLTAIRFHNCRKVAIGYFRQPQNMDIATQ